MCEIVKDYGRNVEEVNIKFCMRKRLEMLDIYRYDIKRDNIGLSTAPPTPEKAGIEGH